MTTFEVLASVVDSESCERNPFVQYILETIGASLQDMRYILEVLNKPISSHHVA